MLLASSPVSASTATLTTAVRFLFLSFIPHIPSLDFVIDHDPAYESLVVAAGDSGHGFKFAPVLGDLIADIVEVPSPFSLALSVIMALVLLSSCSHSNSAQKKPSKFRKKFQYRAPNGSKEGARSTLDAAAAMNVDTIPGPMRTKANL